MDINTFLASLPTINLVSMMAFPAVMMFLGAIGAMAINRIDDDAVFYETVDGFELPDWAVERLQAGVPPLHEKRMAVPTLPHEYVSHMMADLSTKANLLVWNWLADRLELEAAMEAPLPGQFPMRRHDVLDFWANDY